MQGTGARNAASTKEDTVDFKTERDDASIVQPPRKRPSPWRSVAIPGCIFASDFHRLAVRGREYSYLEPALRRSVPGDDWFHMRSFVRKRG
jgi:hypothetical protein